MSSQLKSMILKPYLHLDSQSDVDSARALWGEEGRTLGCQQEESMVLFGF